MRKGTLYAGHEELPELLNTGGANMLTHGLWESVHLLQDGCAELSPVKEKHREVLIAGYLVTCQMHRFAPRSM